MNHAHHAHHDDHDIATMLTRDYWEDRYRSSDAIWSGNPNAQLVIHAADLAPGDALDVGSGEGADAIWLAERGWRVTGMDISAVALDRAAQRAALAGQDIADRIAWRQANLLSWDPAEPPSSLAAYDLVSAQYMHLPRDILQSVHRRLAACVRPGGTMLIVGHHPADLQTSMGRPNVPDMFYTAEDVAATLDPADWQVTVADAPGRSASDPDGRTITIRDAVLTAIRRR